MRFSPTITDLMTSPISAAHALLHHRVNTRPLLDVSQAAPSYPPPPVVIDAIAAAASDPSVATYAPPPGLPAPRSALCLGLGAGTVPHFLRSAGVQTDVVEIDHAIIRLAEQYFLIGAEHADRGKVMHDDALQLQFALIKNKQSEF